MKDVLKQLFIKVLSNGFLVLLIVSVFYILYLRECTRPDPCPAENEVLVDKDVWKDMIALADKPPVVTRETIKIKGDIVYVPATPLPTPVPEPKDTTVNVYSDTLINAEIDVLYKYKVKGVLLEREWQYKPITTTVRVDSIIYVPKLIDNPYPVKTPQNGLYAYGLAGGNANSFLFGGGLDLITKKETMIGYQYQRFGDEGFHSVKIGARISFKKP